MATKQEIGALGEERVSQYLLDDGCVIIDRNWRINEGEIDLIAQDQDGLFLFVEVKTRSSMHYGHPLEAITPIKALRMQRLALAWLTINHRWGSDYRIDCAAVFIARNHDSEVDYRKGVL